MPRAPLLPAMAICGTVVPPPRASKKPPSVPALVIDVIAPSGAAVASTSTNSVPAVWIWPCAAARSNAAAPEAAMVRNRWRKGTESKWSWDFMGGQPFCHAGSDALVLCLLNSYTLAAMDFWLRRGVSDEHILHGSVRSEQRSLSQKDMPPCGLHRFWVLASLLLGHSPTSGDAPSSRLARTQNRCNQCIAI